MSAWRSIVSVLRVNECLGSRVSKTISKKYVSCRVSGSWVKEWVEQQSGVESKSACGVE